MVGGFRPTSRPSSFPSSEPTSHPEEDEKERDDDSGGVIATVVIIVVVLIMIFMTYMYRNHYQYLRSFVNADVLHVVAGSSGYYGQLPEEELHSSQHNKSQKPVSAKGVGKEGGREAYQAVVINSTHHISSNNENDDDHMQEQTTAAKGEIELTTTTQEEMERLPKINPSYQSTI